MTNAETISKPSVLDQLQSWWNTPAKIEADPTAHSFTYKGAGQILVRINPDRQARLDEQGRKLRDERDAKINGAGERRTKLLSEAKARYEAEVAAIEKEHRETAAIATKEFETAEQKLLEGFSARPVIEQGATS